MYNEEKGKGGKIQTEKTSQLVGSKTWICQETGEVRTAAEIEKTTADGGFEKVWLATLMNALELIGGKKFQVAEYLIRNRNRTNNMIVATQRKIANDCGVGSQVVTQTIKALKEVNFIKQMQPGVYIITPDAIWRGGYQARQSVMISFKDIDKDEE